MCLSNSFNNIHYQLFKTLETANKLETVEYAKIYFDVYFIIINIGKCLIFVKLLSTVPIDFD